MSQRQPIFLSDAEAQSLEGKETALMINIGNSSPFRNEPPRDPWEIDDSIEGVTPYDLWFGMTQLVGRNLTDQFEAGKEIAEWICHQIRETGLDPFKAIENGLPGKFRKYVAARREYETKVARQADRAEIYLVNGLYFAAVQISLDPGVLSAQYSILPHNRVDFSVVYNPEWGKCSIGSNTLGPMPHGSSAMIVWQNLAEARRLYQESGKVYLPTTLNLDVLTAAMLAMGYDLPLPWLKYVEALKLGNFSSRLNKRLPDLTPVGKKLFKKDQTKGSWGGSLTFQGSARGERTNITNLEQVLMVMAEVFPKVDGAEPVRLIRPGKK